MILAATFTLSPSTENSFRDPLVPTTPENTMPVEIPTQHQQFISGLCSLSLIICAASTALVASSSCAKGGSPHTQINVLPLSSITSLFKLPSMRYTIFWMFVTMSWIRFIPSEVLALDKSTPSDANITDSLRVSPA